MGSRLVWLQPNAGQNITATRQSSGVGIPSGVNAGPLFNAWRDTAWDDITEIGKNYPCGLGAENCSYAWYTPHRNLGADAHFWCDFDDPPTLVQFDRVKFVCVWDYSARPSNPYVFPQGVPDGTGGPFPGLGTNAHGPRARIAIRNRADSGFLYSPTWYEAGFRTAGAGSGTPVAGNHYCHKLRSDCRNRLAVYGAHSKIQMEWELTSHPEGGPFTFEDLRTMKAGVNGECDSPAWVQFGGVAFVRVRFFHYYIELEVSDPGGYVDSNRYEASHNLRVSRRTRSSINLSMPASEAALDVGDVAFISHPRGLSTEETGWPDDRIERRPAQLLQRTYWPESLKVIDEHLDLHDIRCTAWASFRVGIPWSPELSGMAYLDQGGDFIHERLQDAWSPRPGDSVLLRVPEKPATDIERPNLSEEGLSCAGPDDDEVGAQNTNPEPGAGGWSTVSAVSMTVSDDDNQQIAEEFGYETSQQVDYLAAGSGYLEQTFATGVTAGNLLHVKVRVRNVSVVAPGTDFLQVRLQRNIIAPASTEYWNWTTRTWGASSYWETIPATADVGEVISEAIPVDVGGSGADYLIQIGKDSGSPMVNAASFIVGLASKQMAIPSTVSAGHRPELATLASTITRVGEQWTMDNSGSAQFWFVDRGAALFSWRPFFRADALAAATIKPIARAEGSSNLGRDEVYFESGASVDVIRFRRTKADNATMFTATAEIRDAGGSALRLTRDHVVRVFAQWNDADGSLGRAPYELTVAVAVFLRSDGSFVSLNQATASAEAIDWTGDTFYLGTDDTPRYLDGWMRAFEVKRNPIGPVEATWRR